MTKTLHTKAHHKEAFKDKFLRMNLQEQSKCLIKAIKKHCIECCCGSKQEALKCNVKGCPLYDFRFLLEG